MKFHKFDFQHMRLRFYHILATLAFIGLSSNASLSDRRTEKIENIQSFMHVLNVLNEYELRTGKRLQIPTLLRDMKAAVNRILTGRSDFDIGIIYYAMESNNFQIRPYFDRLVDGKEYSLDYNKEYGFYSYDKKIELSKKLENINSGDVVDGVYINAPEIDSKHGGTLTQRSFLLLLVTAGHAKQDPSLKEDQLILVETQQVLVPNISEPELYLTKYGSMATKDQITEVLPVSEYFKFQPTSTDLPYSISAGCAAKSLNEDRLKHQSSYETVSGKKFLVFSPDKNPTLIDEVAKQDKNGSVQYEYTYPRYIVFTSKVTTDIDETIARRFYMTNLNKSPVHLISQGVFGSVKDFENRVPFFDITISEDKKQRLYFPRKFPDNGPLDFVHFQLKSNTKLVTYESQIRSQIQKPTSWLFDANMEKSFYNLTPDEKYKYMAYPFYYFAEKGFYEVYFMQRQSECDDLNIEKYNYRNCHSEKSELTSRFQIKNKTIEILENIVFSVTKFYGKYEYNNFTFESRNRTFTLAAAGKISSNEGVRTLLQSDFQKNPNSYSDTGRVLALILSPSVKQVVKQDVQPPTITSKQDAAPVAAENPVANPNSIISLTQPPKAKPSPAVDQQPIAQRPQGTPSNSVSVISKNGPTYTCNFLKASAASESNEDSEHQIYVQMGYLDDPENEMVESVHEMIMSELDRNLLGPGCGMKKEFLRWKNAANEMIDIPVYLFKKKVQNRLLDVKITIVPPATEKEIQMAASKALSKRLNLFMSQNSTLIYFGHARYGNGMDILPYDQYKAKFAENIFAGSLASKMNDNYVNKFEVIGCSAKEHFIKKNGFAVYKKYNIEVQTVDGGAISFEKGVEQFFNRSMNLN